MGNRILDMALADSLESHSNAEEHGELVTALELESRTNDLIESYHNVETSSMEQIELEFAANSLEAIHASIENSLESDERGLDRASAHAYDLALRGIIGDAAVGTVNSLESFGGESTRKEATMSMENKVSDTLKKIWEAIKKATKKVVDAVTDFFKKLFDSAEKLAKRAEEVEAQAKKLKDDGAKVPDDAGKFDVPRADRIHWEGGVDSDSVLSGMKAVNDAVPTTASVMADSAKTYYDALAKFYGSTPDPKDMEDLEKEGEKQAKEIEDAVQIEHLAGGKTIEITTKDDDAGFKTDIKIVKSDKNAEVKTTEVDPWSLTDIAGIASNVKTTAEKLNDAKKKREELIKVRKEVSSKAEEFVKAEEKGKLKEKWESAMLQRALRKANKDLLKVVSDLDNYLFNYNRGLLQAAEACTKMYTTGDSGKKKDDDGSSESGNKNDDDDE